MPKALAELLDYLENPDIILEEPRIKGLNMLEQEISYVERIYRLLGDYPKLTDSEIAEMISGVV